MRYILLVILFLLGLAWIMSTDVIAVENEWKVTRTEKIYHNQEVKTQVGSRYVCKDVTQKGVSEETLGRAIILALAGSMIDSEHAMIGAITGILLSNNSNVKLKRICYDEILYDTHIEKVYSYTLVTMSNGTTETQHKIYE
jgi:hypothetical protein